MKLRPAVRPALVSLAYFLLHGASQYLAQGIPIGPRLALHQAPGLAMALLVVGGLRYAPVVLLAHLYFGLLFYPPLAQRWVQLLMPVVTTAGYATAAWVVRKVFGKVPIPRSRQDCIFLILAALAAPLPSLVIGTALLQATGSASGGNPWINLGFRAMAGLSSILTIVPAAVIFVTPWLRPELRPARRHRSPAEKVEIAVQAVFLVLVLWLVYVWRNLPGFHAFSLCFAPLAWIALSQGLPGATLATLVVNLGSYVAIEQAGAPHDLVVQFIIFSLAYAAVGLGTGTAITLRNRAKEDLAASEERLAQVVAGARLGLWNCDLTTGRVAFNQAWAEMLGYRLEEVPDTLGWWQNQVHPEDRARIEALLAEHYAGRTPFFEAEYRCRTSTGTWKWIHSRGSVVARGAAGKPLRIAGTQLDLTERRQQEAEKSQLLDLIEASTDFIGLADLEGRNVYLNPSFLRLRGYPTLAAARGLPIGRNHPDWAARQVIEEGIPHVLAHGAWIGENAMVDAAGKEIPVSQLILLRRDNDGRPAGFSTIARDISRQKEVEEERLRTERNMLETQKLESLGVLAGGIAHDFNNLLTVIVGNVSLAEPDVSIGSAAAGNLQQIKAAALRAAELCKQMLAYSGRSQYSTSKIDLSTLVEDTAHLLKVSISKDCVLKFDLARSLPPVLVDATQIRQIVMNLVINASDAISEGNGVIRITTGVVRADAAYLASTYLPAAVEPGEYVFLEVSDNGCGMTPEVQARIFEPFYTTKFAGRGLGLAAVLGIVRGHRGALKVYSEPGRGSSFKLHLPAAEGSADSSGLAEPSPSGRTEGTILVVDDEENVRTIASQILESAGFRTERANDGSEGVRIFCERPGEFHAVLLDLTMPKMNGEQAFQELRRIRPDIPIILMSGFSAEDSFDRFAGRKLTGFVSKPFDRDSLLSRVHSIATHAEPR